MELTKRLWTDRNAKYASIVILILLIGYTLYGFFWNWYVKEYSSPRFVIATAEANYTSSMDYGKKITYSFDGKRIEKNCVTQGCKNLIIGSKFVLKVWVLDPKIVEYYTNYKIHRNVKMPTTGWRSFEELKKSLTLR